MISRLPAIAPRVANPIAVPMATIMSANKGGRKNNDGIGHRAEPRRPDPMIVEIGLRNGRGERLPQRVEVLGALAAQSDEDQPGDGQLAEVEPVAEPRLEKLFRLGLGKSMRGIRLPAPASR